MKIYHTETQADYDALMVELEEQGCKWLSGRKPTDTKGWVSHKENTCIRVNRGRLTREGIEFFENHLPRIPIIKYKAKVDEKMKFTKENVEKVMYQYLKETKDSVLVDIVSDIYDMDDTPKKAVVPKCFDEWYEEIEAEYSNPDSEKLFALWKLCQKGFGHGFERVDGERIYHESELGLWLNKNRFLAIDAVLYGYTIEEEPQYIVSIMDLDIDRIILVKNKLGYSFELESENDGYWEVHFTEQQIKEYDKRYWAFAVPVEGSK